MRRVATLGIRKFGLAALLALGSAGHAQVAQSVEPTWRAVVVDGATETLLLLDPADPKPVPVGPAVPGVTFEVRDPPRLVLLRSWSRDVKATVFSQSPARTLGPVSLGDCFSLSPLVSASEGLFRVWGVPDRLILSCQGTVVSLDLESGTVATQTLQRGPRMISLLLLDAERVLAVAASHQPFTTELVIYDARTLGVEARVKVDGRLLQPARISGGREIVMIDVHDESAAVPQPTTLRYFDSSTLAETRTIPLGAPLVASRTSADGRFVYATDMDRNIPKQTARQLRILRAETGEVLENVSLLEHGWWFTGDQSLPAMILDRRFKQPALSRLLVLDEGRVRASLPIHGLVRQLSVDSERGRMYVLDERSLAVYTWPGLRLERHVAVGKILESDGAFMSLAPGAARALVVSGSRAVVVDLMAGTVLPEARLGSSGARARKFWGTVAIAPLVMLGGGVGGVRSTDRLVLETRRFEIVPVAFSGNADTAMLRAPTGEISTIEMTTGRAVRHVEGGDGSMAFAGVPLVIAADKQSSWVLNATGDVVARFAVSAAAADAPLSASVSPDGRLVLIGRGAAVHLVEAASGKLIREWQGFERVGVVCFLRNVLAT